MATLLTRALELPPGPDAGFVDVGGTHEANINAIAAANITQGCLSEPLSYCPGNPVTRAQMASFMARGFELPPNFDDNFTDDDGLIHEPNIDAIFLVGITLGCDPGLFCPGQRDHQGPGGGLHTPRIREFGT